MAKDINVLILINSNHYIFFGEKIDKYLSFDIVLSCNPYSGDINEKSIRCLKGFGEWKKFLLEKRKNNERINIITFDYSPLPIYLAVAYAQKYLCGLFSIFFIQHGVFDNKQKDSILPIKTMNWFIMTLYFIRKFVFYQKSVFLSLTIISKYAKYGANEAIKLLIEKYPKIDVAFFWDNISSDFFNEFESLGQRILEKKVVGSPDEVEFIYKKNREVYLISQPLYLTGHCTVKVFKQMISEIVNSYIERGYSLTIILHPKMEKDLIKDVTKIFYLDELPVIIEAERIVGHFSSLLLKVPQDLPLDFWDGEVDTVGKSVDEFKEKYFLSNREDSKNFYMEIKKRIML